MRRDAVQLAGIAVFTLAVGAAVFVSVRGEVHASRDETVRNRGLGSQIDQRAERIERQLGEVLKRLPTTKPTDQ